MQIVAIDDFGSFFYDLCGGEVRRPQRCKRREDVAKISFRPSLQGPSWESTFSRRLGSSSSFLSHYDEAQPSSIHNLKSVALVLTGDNALPRLGK
jgi:hypothetical protein